MPIGDSFTITVNAKRAYDQIGIALLSSPTATVSWADRHNNYAVQVNLNGPDAGGWSPWEVVSTGGTVNASSINASQTDYANFVFKFTLNSATEFNVDMNNGAETFNVTLNNQNITGFSIYLANDWTGEANQNIYFKPTTQYTYATSLSTEDFSKSNISLNVIDNVIELNGLNYNETFELDIYDLSGRLVKKLHQKSNLSIQELAQSVYIVKLKTEDNKLFSKKIIKR